MLIKDKKLNRVSLEYTDSTDRRINLERKSIIKKLIEALDVKQNQTSEIQELKELQRKISLEMMKENHNRATELRRKIEKKISAIQYKSATDKIRNNIPENIEVVIKNLSLGILNIEEANRIIEEEVNNKLQGRPKNNFSVTKEQQKRQLLVQIRAILREKADEYTIINPEKTIVQIQQLCGDTLENAIRIVV